VSLTPESTRLFAALQSIAGALDEQRLPWALVGGLAVSIRVEPRFTRDIDIAVAVADDAVAEALVSGLVARGFTLQLTLEQKAAGRLAAVRLLPPGESEEGVVVDLLFRSSGIEPEICGEAEPIEIARGLTVPVARSGHLAAMKLLALAPDRPQDAVDLRALLDGLSRDEHERLNQALAHIEERGTNRGKALRDELSRWLG